MFSSHACSSETSQGALPPRAVRVSAAPSWSASTPPRAPAASRSAWTMSPASPAAGRVCGTVPERKRAGAGYRRFNSVPLGRTLCFGVRTCIFQRVPACPGKRLKKGSTIIPPTTRRAVQNSERCPRASGVCICKTTSNFTNDWARLCCLLEGQMENRMKIVLMPLSVSVYPRVLS